MLTRFLFILLVITSACNQQDTAGKETQTDSIQKKDTNETNVNKDLSRLNNNDILTDTAYEKELLDLSINILKTIKERNYTALADYIYPVSGIRFSLYAYVDTVNDQILSQKNLIALGKNQAKINWAPDEESGKPVLLTIDSFFRRFVYDVDFINSEKRAVNKFIGFGNSLNNLKEIYPGCDFTEFYFSGFDPKYDGMDWRTLRLVFKKNQGKPFLVGIVHDEWTI